MPSIGKRNIPNTLPANFLAAIFFAVLFFTHASAQAATLGFSPSGGTYHVGQSISVRVLVNSANQSINAVSGTLTFSDSTLALEGISKSGIVTLWAQDPSYSNGSATASFQGVILNGYTGGAGTVVTLLFEAKAAGPATVAFSNGTSSVLLNDGQGTNVLSGTSGASFSIVPAVPQTEPATTIKSSPLPSAVPSNAQTSATTPSPALASATAGTPVITSYQTPLAPGDFVVVKGTAAADSTVTITLANTGHIGNLTTQQVTVPTNASGMFTFVSDQRVSEGDIYSIIVTSLDGRHTAALLMKVKNSLWFTVATFFALLFAIQLPAWLVLLLLIMIVLYFAYRNHVLKQHLQTVIDKMHEMETK